MAGAGQIRIVTPRQNYDFVSFRLVSIIMQALYEDIVFIDLVFLNENKMKQFRGSFCKN